MNRHGGDQGRDPDKKAVLRAAGCTRSRRRLEKLQAGVQVAMAQGWEICSRSVGLSVITNARRGMRMTIGVSGWRGSRVRYRHGLMGLRRRAKDCVLARHSAGMSVGAPENDHGVRQAVHTAARLH